jgi:hypothetical protein
MINSKSTINRLLDDLETIAAWREDLDARIARAEICFHSSVGLSDERREALVHEGRVWDRAARHMEKRWERKRDDKE